MADAGKAMMLYKGVYDSTYAYEKLDVVNYNGSLYISTTDGNLGTEPDDETKWKLFLQGGIADNIQAADTHGLVGTAGESSFVQLLLDALAANTVKKANILNTVEEIEANTSVENIAGALAVNSLKSNFANSIDALNSKLIYVDKKYFAGIENAVTIGANQYAWVDAVIPTKEGYELVSCTFTGANGNANGLCLYQLKINNNKLLIYNQTGSENAAPYNIGFRFVFAKK